MGRAAAALDDAARDRPAGGGGVDGGAAAGRGRRCRCARPARVVASGWPGSRRAAGRRTARAWADWFAERDGAFETLWLTDGIGHGGEEALARALLARGPVTVVAAAARPPLALTPPRLEAGALPVMALRAGPGAARPVGVTGAGARPERHRAGARLGHRRIRRRRADGCDLALDLPVELRNRVGRVQLAEGAVGGGRGAGRRFGAPAQGRADVGPAGRRGAGSDRSAALPAQGAASPSPR